MTTTPKRVQLHRTKGWRKPDGAISVARPHKWGNPFVVGEHGIRSNADAAIRTHRSRRPMITRVSTDKRCAFRIL